MGWQNRGIGTDPHPGHGGGGAGHVRRERYVDANAPGGGVDPVNDAVDFWNRYPEDIARAAEMGVTTFRLSVEWARIEPAPGEYDDDALARYDQIIDEIRRHGMAPMITMVYFTYPGWLADRGGMLAADTPEAFGRFAELITNRWAGDGTLWVTVNEPLTFFKHELTIGQVAPRISPCSSTGSRPPTGPGTPPRIAPTRTPW